MKRKKGFTLVELILYVAILGMVIVGLLSFALSVSSIHAKTTVSAGVVSNARVALSIIEQKIRAASRINVGSSVFNTNAGALSLTMADPSKNPTRIDVDPATGRLRVTEGASAPVFITASDVRVSQLLFENLSQSGEREHIEAYLTISYQSNTGTDYSYVWSGKTAVSVRQ